MGKIEGGTNRSSIDKKTRAFLDDEYRPLHGRIRDYMETDRIFKRIIQATIRSHSSSSPLDPIKDISLGDPHNSAKGNQDKK